MGDPTKDHVAAGWNADGSFRSIEAGRLRFDEDDKGAVVTVLGDEIYREDRPKSCWLSATELVGLTRHLAGWFAEDPTGALGQIETHAKHVKTELEAWNDRARIDEDHPPYDDLTRSLSALLGICRGLRE